MQDLHIGFGEKFPWCHREAVLITQNNYTTGTVTVNKGATAVTGASTLWNTNNSFGVANVRTTGKIVFNGEPEIYKITTVGSDTSITLDSRFVGENLAAGTYEYFEDEYALHADFLRPLSLQFFDRNRSIGLIGRDEFFDRYPRSKIVGAPSVATIVDRSFASNTTPVRRVLFWKPPDDFYMIPYQFVTNKLAVSSAGVAQTSLSANADEPIVPLQYRHGIVLKALEIWYRDRKDDVRSGEVKAEYAELVMRIAGDQEIGQTRPRIQPRVSHYASRARTPWRGGGRRTHVLGAAFDEIRE